MMRYCACKVLRRVPDIEEVLLEHWFSWWLFGHHTAMPYGGWGRAQESELREENKWFDYLHCKVIHPAISSQASPLSLTNCTWKQRHLQQCKHHPWKPSSQVPWDSNPLRENAQISQRRTKQTPPVDHTWSSAEPSQCGKLLFISQAQESSC